MLRILRRPAVIEATGLSGTRIDELEREGRFPARRRISDRAVGWISQEIEDYIASRPLASETPPDLAGNPRARGVGRRKGKGSTDAPEQEARRDNSEEL